VRERIYTLPPAQLAGIRAALAGVVSERGTAGGARLASVVIAGKTGTAQSGTYRNGVELNHAWFTGYAPADNPKIVVAVMLENVLYHGSVTALMASKIIEAYFKRPATASAAVAQGE
jgi:cell division protein FtsI/penicillin-binding protein 2